MLWQLWPIIGRQSLSKRCPLSTVFTCSTSCSGIAQCLLVHSAHWMWSKSDSHFWQLHFPKAHIISTHSYKQCSYLEAHGWRTGLVLHSTAFFTSDWWEKCFGLAFKTSLTDAVRYSVGFGCFCWALDIHQSIFYTHFSLFTTAVRLESFSNVIWQGAMSTTDSLVYSSQSKKEKQSVHSHSFFYFQMP